MIFVGLASALAQGSSEPEALARARRFVDQVVRVIPQRIDGAAAEDGFGLIVGERAGKVYIATPSHVVLGLGPTSLLNATPGVIFRGDRYNTIRGRRLDVASQNDDLAVVEVTPPRGLALSHAPMVPATLFPLGTWVWNIGISQDWDMPDRAGGLGPEDIINHRRRIGQLRTPPGASGGAGVTDSGVIGIVLEAATDYSLLLPIERVVELFKAWDLPVNLLRLAPTAQRISSSPPAELVAPTPPPEVSDAHSQYELAIRYNTRQGNVPRRPTEAARLFRLAADQGLSEAQLALAKAYKDGDGLPKDLAQALHWLQLASGQGLAEAQFKLGLAYRDGDWGLPKDLGESTKLFQRSAEQGFTEAEYFLGIQYADLLPQKDYTKALFWLKKAAEARDQNRTWPNDARSKIGLIYRDGQGQTTNWVEAKYWFEKSMEGETNPGIRASTIFHIGFLYEQGGYGLPKDLAEAVRQYRQAAILGSFDARERLRRLGAN